ncbi:hypothetical protein [Acrocarpospora catenulata]|uniref:hypothetical protein n=1 Tax=Acrocarpospora catenulata TaxID=2836182 RepID=UPI001BDA5AA4|nr:hypothetical protein [Acrocarpospora catenulata]
MTIPPDEYGDVLRRALRAEADSVVPSPAGLDIIRERIENRGMRGFNGLRGLIWWRIGAAVAVAAMVAGTIVMVVPGLRDRVGTEIGLLRDTTPGQLPEIGATNQPAPAPTDEIVIVTASPSVAGEVPPRAAQTTAPSPTPSAGSPDPCATPSVTPTVVEPDATGDDDCPPGEAPASPTPSPKPSASDSPSATPSPTPSGCSGAGCDSPTPLPQLSEKPTPEAAPSQTQTP